MVLKKAHTPGEDSGVQKLVSQSEIDESAP